MKQLAKRALELVIGRWQESPALACARIALGVVIPAIILIFAWTCIATRRAYIVDRTARLTEVTGLPAIAIAIAYAAAGLIIYVHFCWEDHEYLSGLRDFMRQVLVIVMGVALALTLGLALLEF